MKKILGKDPSLKVELAYAVQEAIVDALCFKVSKAIEKTGVRRLVVAGGVAANKQLRNALRNTGASEIFAPQLNHCMDNGAMVAFAGFERMKLEDYLSPEAGVLPRWPIEELSS